MARSAISVNSEAFVKSLNDTSRSYHSKLMIILARIADDIRFQAAENVIPRKIPTRKFNKWALIRLWRLQPPAPSKVTERTGKLLDVLQSGGRQLSNWKIPKSLRQATLKNVSKHLLFKIVPQKAAKDIFYIMTGKLREKGEIPDMKGRIIQEKRKGRLFFKPAAFTVGRKIEPKLIRALAKEMNKTL